MISTPVRNPPIKAAAKDVAKKAKAPAAAKPKGDSPKPKAARRSSVGPYAKEAKFLDEQRLLLESERAIYMEQATALKAEADSLAQEREPGDVQFDEESGEGGTVTVDRDFDAVLDGCAQPWPGRPRTWINARIRLLYRKLYERRHCHSLEVYEGNALVGGLYGVTLGRAFFGESMFHRVRDASKVALVHLVARLKAGGFRLLDTQFVTDHLRTFGAIEVPRRQYHKLLEAALSGEGDFAALDMKRPITGAQALAKLLTPSLHAQ